MYTSRCIRRNMTCLFGKELLIVIKYALQGYKISVLSQKYLLVQRRTLYSLNTMKWKKKAKTLNKSSGLTAYSLACQLI